MSSGMWFYSTLSRADVRIDSLINTNEDSLSRLCLLWPGSLQAEQMNKSARAVYHESTLRVALVQNPEFWRP